jgi:DnaK suppressor protein
MSESMKELTAVEREELRQDLLALEEALKGSITAARPGARPVDLDLPIGRISRIDAIQQQQMAQASLTALELRSRQVGSALSAFASDEYGYCRKCGEPIGFKRLKARPETPFCLACQAGAEAAR